MKIFCSLLLSLSLLSCSSKKVTTDSMTQNEKSFERHAFLNDCSWVDNSISEFWILLCQKDPHPQRSELYEYSLLFKTFKRLTYQDGRIQEMAVIGIDDIIYTSTYDEAKEKFLEVSQGSAPGTDLYLRRRTVTDFKRISNDEGSDHSLFWSKELKALLFVNSSPKGHIIRKLTTDEKIFNLSKPSPRPIISPITLADGSLLWIERDESNQRSLLFKRSAKTKESRALVSSTTPLIWIRPQVGQPSVWLAFANQSGSELWSFDLDRGCFYPRLMTDKKWTRFQLLDNQQVELAIEDSGRTRLVRHNLNKPPETCQFSPALLGGGK
ncbi:MAG: hypothetical protein ACK5V3_06700 [Bdellovibrionales bacterium]